MKQIFEFIRLNYKELAIAFIIVSGPVWASWAFYIVTGKRVW